MNTFKILEETTIKFVLTGIIRNSDKIRKALNLDKGYQLSIISYSNQNITVIIATKRDDDAMSVII